MSFLLVEPGRQVSPEQDQEAKKIAKRVNDRGTECFDHLNRTYQELCVNLDVQKRINLSAATLFCEHRIDNRSDRLPELSENPVSRNYTRFVEELDDDTFGMFTTIFISVDSICFHATHEAQSTANIETVDRIYQASTMAIKYLVQSKEKLVNITNNVVDKLGDVYEAMNDTEVKIVGFQNRVVGIVDQFNNLTDKARYYRNSVSNMKFYLIGLGVSFFTNLIIPNVFIPTISLTALYLLIECTLGDMRTGMLFKWSYALVVGLVHLSGVWWLIHPIGELVFGNRNRPISIPLQFSAPIAYSRR